MRVKQSAVRLYCVCTIWQSGLTVPTKRFIPKHVTVKLSLLANTRTQEWCRKPSHTLHPGLWGNHVTTGDDCTSFLKDHFVSLHAAFKHTTVIIVHKYRMNDINHHSLCVSRRINLLSVELGMWIFMVTLTTLETGCLELFRVNTCSCNPIQFQSMWVVNLQPLYMGRTLQQVSCTSTPITESFNLQYLMLR